MKKVLDIYFGNFLKSENVAEHKEAIIQLLKGVALDKEFQKATDKQGGDIHLAHFLVSMQQIDDRYTKSPSETISCRKLGKLASRYYQQKEYHKITDLAFTQVLRNLIDASKSENSFNIKDLTFDDFFNKYLSREIMLQYFILETLAKNEEFNWERNKKIIDQTFICACWYLFCRYI